MKRIGLIAFALCGLACVLGGCDKKMELNTVPVTPNKEDIKTDKKGTMTLPPLPPEAGGGAPKNEKNP